MTTEEKNRIIGQLELAIGKCYHDFRSARAIGTANEDPTYLEKTESKRYFRTEDILRDSTTAKQNGFDVFVPEKIIGEGVTGFFAKTPIQNEVFLDVATRLEKLVSEIREHVKWHSDEPA